MGSATYVLVIYCSTRSICHLLRFVFAVLVALWVSQCWFTLKNTHKLCILQCLT